MNSPTDAMIEELAQLCRSHSLSLPIEVLEKIRIHFDLLVKWNRKISLTTITSPDAAARQLYFEPIFASTLIEPDISTAADVGSGGGFPGLPFSFVRPDLRLTLIEADRRKAAFLG